MRKREGGNRITGFEIFELRDREKWGAKRSSPGGGGE